MPDQPVDVGEPGEVEERYSDLRHRGDRRLRLRRAGRLIMIVVGHVDVDVVETM